MSFEQIAILALLGLLLFVFALDRFRIELVALTGLAAGYALGLVPATGIFSGFASPAVVTVVEILLIVQVLTQTQFIAIAGSHIAALRGGEPLMVGILCGLTAFLSIFMNNVGALAIMLPVAFSACNSLHIPLERVMMPLSFSTLLGGLCSVVGTPANLVVSQFLESATGSPLKFFELAYAGIPLVITGLVYFVFLAPKLPIRRVAASLPGGLPSGISRRLFTELRVPQHSKLAGASVKSAEAARDLKIHGVVRTGQFVFGGGARKIEPGDILVAEIPATRLTELRQTGDAEFANLRFTGEDPKSFIEAVVLPESILVGSKTSTLERFREKGIEIVAIAALARRLDGRLADFPLSNGDILVARGDRSVIYDEFSETGALPLSAKSDLDYPAIERGVVPFLAFAGGILISVLEWTPPEVAFGLVVLFLGLLGRLRLREGLEVMNWPIVLMLGAMIPLGEAVQNTGAAVMLARDITSIMPTSTPVILIACVLGLGIAITAVVNNPSTAIVLAPIALEIAHSLDVSPVPFLVAVAVGASLDFLTPFGHHNNTLVMGIAGYRFQDFLKVGTPLTVLSFIVTIAAIVTVYF